MPDTRLEALPFDEAIAAFTRRHANPLPSGAWHSVAQATHADAFTVAQSAGYDILGDVVDSLRTNHTTGGTFAEWKKDITPILQAKGWWGKTTDGIQLGSPRRLRTIYDVNLRVSHAAGHWAQIERTKDRRPYLRYSAILDGRTRDAHRRWSGTVLPVDDPWWSTHAPPNGWRCRCTVQQLGPRDLARYGYEVGNPPPDTGTRLWTNPSTGEVTAVPVGIDPGWAYNPGRTSALGTQALAKLADKPPALAASAGTTIAGLLPRVGDEYRVWLDTLDLAKPAGEVRSIGLLSSRVVQALAAEGREPVSAVIRVRDHDIAHMMRDAKAAQKKRRDGSLKPPVALSWEDVKRLPEVLAAPEAILLDGDALIYVFPAASGRAGKAIVKVNYQTKVRDRAGDRQSATLNLLRTGGQADAASLRDRSRYVLLEGDWPS